MKKEYDICLMNPPYGKNANLAIQFVNNSSKLAKTTIAILPRTLRKTATQNRINKKLHLISDENTPDNTFGIELATCVQQWTEKSTDRESTKIYTKHMVSDYFEFTTRDKGDVCIPRVGRYGTGEVIPRNKDMGHRHNYLERSPNTTYYLKIKRPDSIKKLEKLYPKFQEASRDVVGPNSLSIDNLVKIFMEAYVK